MRRDHEDMAAPECEDADETEVGVDFDVERPRRMTPARKKAIAYKRDRRFIANDPHRERRSWPKRKALRTQTWRRGVDAALRRALGGVTPEVADFAPVLPKRKRSQLAFRHENISLGQWVDRKLDKRFSFVGRNIGAKITQPWYRRRLIPFLEALTTGRDGHTVELACRFRSILDDLADPGRLRRPDRRQLDLPYWMSGWYRALSDLFEEQPEWEGRLRAWIAEVAGDAPAAEEPAWKRIRRLRKQRSR